MLCLTDREYDVVIHLDPEINDLILLLFGEKKIEDMKLISLSGKIEIFLCLSLCPTFFIFPVFLFFFIIIFLQVLDPDSMVDITKEGEEEGRVEYKRKKKETEMGKGNKRKEK